MRVKRIPVVQEGVGVVVRKLERVRPCVAGNEVVDILRVEFLQFLLMDADHLAYLAEMEVPPYLEGIDMGRHPHRLGHYAVFFVVSHRVQGSDEGRHVSAGLFGQIGIYGPEVIAASLADGFVDIAGSAVVCGYGEAPVPEDVVLVPQIACRRIGGLFDIKPLVNVRVYLQSIGLGGIVHELPHAFRSCSGDGNRVERRLDDGHRLEFLRQPVPVEYVLEDGHVVRTQAEYMCHLGGHLLGV